jgi:hypothetical protein
MILAEALLFAAMVLALLIPVAQARRDTAPQLPARVRMPLESFLSDFARLIDEQDYRRAYGRMSAAYRDGTSLEAFAQAHEEARARFGIPLSMEVWIENAEAGQVETWFPLPDYVEPGSVRAWGVATFRVAGAADSGPVTACYDLYQVVIEERGELRCAHFIYSACE